MTVINYVIFIYDKQGNKLSSATLSSFFPQGSGSFDPRALYDQSHHRFVVLATDGFGTSTSKVMIAVSQADDALGTWSKYYLDFNLNNTYADYPTLGVSQTALYIGTMQLPLDSTLNSTWMLTVIQLQGLLSGSSTLEITRFPNITDINGYTVAVQGAETVGNSAYELLLASGQENPHLGLTAFFINTAGTPTIIKRGFIVPQFYDPSAASQPNSTVQIYPCAGLTNPVQRNGSLWFVHTVSSAYGASPMARWYEIDASSLAIKQMGDVKGAGEAVCGAIAPMANGEVGMVFTTSSTTQYASAGYAHRYTTDAVGVMSEVGIYHAGSSSYGKNRWGDLQEMAIDPVDDSAWGIAEDAEISTFSDYGTAVVQIKGPSANGSVTVSPTALNFGSQVNGTTSAAQTVQLSNGTSTPLAISSIAATSNFTDSNNCGSQLPAGWVCSIKVFFHATVSGAKSGSLTVTSSDTASPHSIRLSGTGVACPLKTTNPSVTICTPGNNATATSPVTVIAGTTDSHPVSSMQIFVDGLSKYKVTGGRVNTAVSMSAGYRRLTVQARDSAGVTFKQTIYITVH